ncbi:MAG: hypothetical protein K6A44_02795 [bacterium]|nr:hypothetical protein [bacterium]
MKKNLLTAGVIAIAAVGLMSPAMSEDNIFGDLNTQAPATTDLTTTVKVDQPVVIRGTQQMNQTETLTTQSLQSSITSLEAAQNDLRTKLETAQSNFNVADQEFKRVKQERAALRKIVRQTNSRIKSLERAKKRVQKTIQTEL